MGRGGCRLGRSVSPAPLPPPNLRSLLPIFQRNQKPNSPPSSQKLPVLYLREGRFSPVCLEAELLCARGSNAASNVEREGRGSGWVDDSFKIFLPPFLSFSFPFFLFFFLATFQEFIV